MSTKTDKRYPDHTTTRRTHKRRALWNAAAQRMGFTSGDNIIREFVAAMEQGGTNGNVSDALIKVLDTLKDNAYAYQLHQEAKLPQEARDVAAILKQYPRLKSGPKPKGVKVTDNLTPVLKKLSKSFQDMGNK